MCTAQTETFIDIRMYTQVQAGTPAQTLAPTHCHTHIHIYVYSAYTTSPSSCSCSTGTRAQTHTWACVQTHRHRDTGPYPGMHTHIPAHRGTQTHPEVSLHHVGPQNDCHFPPDPASPACGPKQPPPASIMPAPSQDRLPPLPNPDENYVIPIDDAPAADYVNGDGEWGPRVAKRRGRGTRLMARYDTPHLCPRSGFPWLARGPEAQEVSTGPKGSGKAFKATHYS